VNNVKRAGTAQLILALSAFCGLILLTGQLNAQTWPSRTVKLIVPTGPGTATDVTARLIADALARSLFNPVVVENMPGGSGIVAHQAAARAEPDGHTLLFTNTSGMATNLISFKQLPYDPSRDFIPIAMVCNLGPQMLSVNADVPVKSVSEFIAYSTARRGKVTIAFDTTAGAAPFAAKLLNRRADLGLIEVPYRSSAQMVQDVGSGINQAMMSSITAASPLVQSGKVHRLAVTSAQRFPGLPELPALTETVPGVVMNGWFALVAPTGTPAPVAARLNGQIGEYLKSSEIQQRLLAFGLATQGAGTPESTARFIREEQEQWRAIARELDVQPQ